MLQVGRWTKARASQDSGCFWALWDGDEVHVKDEHGNEARYTREEWEIAEAGFKAGDFSLPPQ